MKDCVNQPTVELHAGFETMVYTLSIKMVWCIRSKLKFFFAYFFFTSLIQSQLKFMKLSYKAQHWLSLVIERNIKQGGLNKNDVAEWQERNMLVQLLNSKTIWGVKTDLLSTLVKWLTWHMLKVFLRFFYHS